MDNKQEKQQSSSKNEAFLTPVKKQKTRRKFILGLAVLVLAGTGGWYYKTQVGKVEADQPLLVPVSVGSIENTISATGALKPSNYVDVGAQVSGLLEKLHVEVGDEVVAGQLLAEIDARVQAANVDASIANLEGQKAQLDSRRSALELARSTAERQERLFNATASSQQEYDNAINSLRSAEASLIELEKRIEQSTASLLTEQTELEFTKIYAPVDGTVVSIEMNEGRTLNVNQQAPTILRIADLKLMTVETQISEADIGKVKKGMPVYFTTLGGGNRRWSSTLRQVLPTPVVTNNVVLYTGLFDIENTDSTLLPEMTAQVYFVSSSARNVLTVPMGALTFINSGQASGGATGGTTSAGGNGSPDFSQIRERMASGDIPAEMRERIQQMRESGNFPAGGFPGGGGGAGPGFGSARLTQPGERSLARVTVVNDDGTREDREVVIGLTSRVSAEVISGLKAGEQVVAGIVQSSSAESSSDNNNNNFNPRMMMRF